MHFLFFRKFIAKHSASNLAECFFISIICRKDYFLESILTEYGNIDYTLTRKKVRNLNLRIKSTGDVLVSAPLRMPQKTIDHFLQEKAGWIIKTQTKLVTAAKVKSAPQFSAEESLALFITISDQIFPLFSTILSGEKPLIKVRAMKTRWGVCHMQKRMLVFNTALAEKPLEAIEYVVLHEYVHFLHADHQAGFHAEMLRLMPDYKARRKLLR